ncbi:methionine adenosyltransferase [Mycoplasma iguanae]|uniref:S-adenosylmethionine synthase n=1 Tax=Mycoplasma iguanae TaxID=292461 RepID=A0ABY5R7X5_9MOLU|nr:methionine adenosyltransferase [Mycoplasma iguanae]UVD81608.1 methionine adenosyltransferase [Mycoplasma iguanae]
MYKTLFTSESVGTGHPDKICDQISDAILDAYLQVDPKSRVACEVLATFKKIVVTGEFRSTIELDLKPIVLRVLNNVGYSEKDFEIEFLLNHQSDDISQGVDKKDGEIGAGDQGIMFGYATNETKEFMPLPITLAHALVKRAEKLRKSGAFKWAKSDMKSQVTFDYSNSQPKIKTILMSIQHDQNFEQTEFFDFIKNEIMIYVAKKYHLNTDFEVLINPTGRFVIGGPVGDVGLTGRKIIVDTYGGFAKHGGGAFSGKDYTKVDRSAAYAARWVAKNLVAAGISDSLEIQLSYAIGIAKPISIAVDTFYTSKYSDDEILKIINQVFDLSPAGIFAALDLQKPIYEKTATFGHFGRKYNAQTGEFSWERLNKVEVIQSLLKTE